MLNRQFTLGESRIVDYTSKVSGLNPLTQAAQERLCRRTHNRTVSQRTD
jgi:hypothetical protein